MKQIALIITTFFLALTVATAQPQHDKVRDRIKALKIAYVTEKLDLSSDQATKFWPVYNSFEKEKHTLRKSFYSKFKDENPTADKKAAHNYIEANLDYQEQELALKKKYKDKLLKVISPEQLVELYQAETGFKRMLLKELHDRRQSQGRNTHK